MHILFTSHKGQLLSGAIISVQTRKQDGLAKGLVIVMHEPECVLCDL